MLSVKDSGNLCLSLGGGAGGALLSPRPAEA